MAAVAKGLLAHGAKPMETATTLPVIDRAQEIDGLGIKLYFWSRSPYVLAALAAVILAVAAGVGWWLRAPDGFSNARPGQAFIDELDQPQPDMARVLDLLAGFQRQQAGQTRRVFADVQFSGAGERILRSGLSADDKAVAVAYAESVLTYDGQPSADLLWLAHQVHPLPHANELVADLHAAAKATEKAHQYYERELRFTPGASAARAKLIELFHERRDYAAITRALADPAFKMQQTPELTLKVAVAGHRWGDLAGPVTAIWRGFFMPLPLALAALAGLVWLVIVLQLGQPQSIVCFRTAVPLLAVVAGMASTWATLCAVFWQDEMWGLKQTGDLFGDAAYFIGGVGVREELVKLVFFLPFVPLLLRRKNRLETIITAGCVGLGFAVAENLIYFASAGPAAAFGRFLTANFMHAAMTGLIGLALCDALTQPLKKGWVFLVTLPAVILVHGLYDLILSLPVETAKEKAGLACLAGMLFILLALFFFHQLRPLRDAATDQVNLAAILIAGLSILTGVIFVCAAHQLGFAIAVVCLLLQVFVLGMIAYLFYWQLGEGMSAAAVQVEEKPNYAL